MQNPVTLTAPLYLLRIAQIFMNVTTESPPVIGIKPKKAGAEMPDDFSNAAVFPIDQIDRHYEPYGPAIYELSSIDADLGRIRLRLSESWCKLARTEHYRTDPFLLHVENSAALAWASEIAGCGPCWAQAPSPRPLVAEDVERSCFIAGNEQAWEYLMQVAPYRPVYSMLSSDENGVITLQLHPDWLRHRNSLLMTVAERADAFLC